MKKLLFTLLLLIVFPLMASHIVGGEFELLHISGNLYQLNLIIYFDQLHGAVGAKDPNVTATIYRKRDKRPMINVFLPLVSETKVGYTQPVCSHGEIVTTKLTYTSTVTLPDNDYNDPQGYYVSWQRCCRNYQITNIYSNPPISGDPSDPNSAGQTFYLEFPPVVKNGVKFFNSSPRLFPPLNDYACPHKPYYVNFAGVDDDNDSLVYSLVTPLNTFTSLAPSPIAPGPYPLVRWRPGYSLDNIINGAPDLHITTDGFLTATPKAQGLYVFAVRVDQYRDKRKIGESRRDFQMLVVDGCQPAQPPHILGKKLADATFTYNNTMAVTFDNTVADTSRCIQVRVSDPDSDSSADHFMENISIQVIPLNFSKKKNINGILPSVTAATLEHGSVKDFTICFPQCPFIDGPYQIGIIAYDDACSLPLSDTLRVAVTVQPPPNSPPYFTTPTLVTAVLDEGDSATWSFEVRDNDLDPLILSLVTDGFVLADAGMSFTVQTQENGHVRGQIHWDAYCNIYDFTKRTSFQVKIMVNDADLCATGNPVVAVYNLAVKLPGVADPLVDTDLTSDPHENLVTGLVRRIGESLSFNVTGMQSDNDLLHLSIITPGFKASDHDISFASVSGNGTVTSHFQWDIGCTNVDLKKRDMFEFQFVLVDDANKCRFLKTDTVVVEVKIVPSENSKPEVVLQTLSDTPLVNNQMSVELGQPISVNVLGDDADVSPSDNITLTLIDANGNVPPEGYSFTGAQGLGTVASPFTWNPDCSIFHDGIFQNQYVFRFGITDDRCFNVKGDTVTLELTIKDIEATGKPFLPTNVITPNGDNCNDYFAVEGIDPVAASVDSGCGGIINPDEQISLPRDNCIGRFQFIRIYNRWGKLVFESTERRFRWFAENETAGVYYYLILFGNQEFKGVLSVRP